LNICKENILINPGSLIGAIIGFLIGTYLGGYLFGILFALIGSSIGSSIGVRVFRNSRGRESSTGWFSGWGAGVDGAVFMETLFSMLGSVAAADGGVSSNEERVFRSIVINDLGITDPTSVESAMSTFRKAAASRTGIKIYASRAASTFRGRPQLLEMMLIIMVRVAAAEGGLHPKEDEMMSAAARIFGFRSGFYQSLKNRYGFGGTRGYQSNGSSDTASLTRAYEVLNIPSNASESEVKRAYRKKVSEYHPDKIAAKGLPKDFTDLANAKFREIKEAWDSIRISRGY